MSFQVKEIGGALRQDTSGNQMADMHYPAALRRYCRYQRLWRCLGATRSFYGRVVSD